MANNKKITNQTKLKDLAEGTLAIFKEELETKKDLTDFDKQILKVSEKISEQADKQTLFGQASLKIEEAIFKWTDRKKDANADMLSDLFKANKESRKSLDIQKNLNKLLENSNEEWAELLKTAIKFVFNPLTAALAISKIFSDNLDKIGESFGVAGLHSLELRDNLMKAQVSAIGVGKGMEDVVASTRELTSNFGIGLSDAVKMSASVIDTGGALGNSTTEAANLVGTFKALTGLSTDQSTALAKNVYLLAQTNDVAPQQILSDMSQSSEAIASFTDATGENIARAAIQARKLGTSLSEVAASAKSLLDYQASYQNSLEASVLVGREINVERMMELSLAGDLEGLQKEQIKQLGTQAEWSKLNTLQRDALAKAVGLSVDQAAKLVNKEKEQVSLGGQLAQQKSFEALAGKNAISNLTQIVNSFKKIGASVTASIGPTISFIAGTLSTMVGWAASLEENFRGMSIVMGALLIRSLASAIPTIFSSFAAIPIGLGIPHAMATVGALWSNVAKAKSTKMATGGIVTGATQATVGEAGPEAVVPLDAFYRRFDALQSEVAGVKDAIMKLELTTKITNKDLNVVLTPTKA